MFCAPCFFGPIVARLAGTRGPGARAGDGDATDATDATGSGNCNFKVIDSSIDIWYWSRP